MNINTLVLLLVAGLLTGAMCIYGICIKFKFLFWLGVVFLVLLALIGYMAYHYSMFYTGLLPA